jgi:TPR repeat protein
MASASCCREAASFNLGVLYATGDLLPKDDGKAAALYWRACELGDLAGCVDTGNRLVRGWGVEQNIERGVALVGWACREGDGRACGYLGEYQQTGLTSGADPRQLTSMYRTGCERGSAYACHEYLRACDGQQSESCKPDLLRLALQQGLTWASEGCGSSPYLCVA